MNSWHTSAIISQHFFLVQPLFHWQGCFSPFFFMCSLRGCVHTSQTGGCRTCSTVGFGFHRATNDRNTSVGVSPPMTVRQIAFQIWAERWWVSLPVISCCSLVFPAAQRPRGGGGINKFPETTEQQQCGLVASKRMCQVAFHEMILWNSVENEFTSCFVPLVYLWHTIFFPRAWKVLLNWGARSCSLLLDSYCCNLSVKTSSDKIGNTNFVGNTNVI